MQWKCHGSGVIPRTAQTTFICKVVAGVISSRQLIATGSLPSYNKDITSPKVGLFLYPKKKKNWASFIPHRRLCPNGRRPRRCSGHLRPSIPFGRRGDPTAFARPRRPLRNERGGRWGPGPHVLLASVRAPTSSQRAAVRCIESIASAFRTTMWAPLSLTAGEAWIKSVDVLVLLPKTPL